MRGNHLVLHHLIFLEVAALSGLAFAVRKAILGAARRYRRREAIAGGPYNSDS